MGKRMRRAHRERERDTRAVRGLLFRREGGRDREGQEERQKEKERGGLSQLPGDWLRRYALIESINERQ